MKINIRKTKGFTLAELLVVVAIIGVLVSISIPIFSSQLEKSREAADIANVRDAYAIVRAAALTGDETGLKTGVTYMNGVYTMSVDLKQKQDNWQSDGPFNIGGVQSSDALHWKGSPKANGKCEISCSKDGETLIAWTGGIYLGSENMGSNIYSILSKLPLANNSRYDSNAPATTGAGAETTTHKIQTAFDKAGIDMEEMGVKTWKTFKTGSSYLLYVTPVDISGYTESEIKALKIPVMAYKIESNGNITYSYGLSNGEYNTTNRKPDGTGACNCLAVSSLTGFASTPTDSYNDAVAGLNKLLKDNGFSDQMNLMP